MKATPVGKIVEAYDLRQSGKSYKTIAQITGLPESNIFFVLKNIEKYLTHFSDIKQPRKNYTSAKKMIEKRGHTLVEAPVAAPVTVEPELDPLTAFEQAKAAYEQATFELIKALVAEQVEAQVKEIKEENESLKELMENAKRGNLISNLRRHFTGRV